MYPLELKLRDIRDACFEILDRRWPLPEPRLLRTECVEHPVDVPFGPEAASGRPMCSERQTRYRVVAARRIGADKYQILETQAQGGLFAKLVDKPAEIATYDDAAKKLETWSVEEHRHPMWKQKDTRPAIKTPMHFSRHRRSGQHATAG